jgi:hypothetical protein
MEGTLNSKAVPAVLGDRIIRSDDPELVQHRGTTISIGSKSWALLGGIPGSIWRYGFSTLARHSGRWEAGRATAH